MTLNDVEGRYAILLQNEARQSLGCY